MGLAHRVAKLPRLLGEVYCGAASSLLILVLDVGIGVLVWLFRCASQDARRMSDDGRVAGESMSLPPALLSHKMPSHNMSPCSTIERELQTLGSAEHQSDTLLKPLLRSTPYLRHARDASASAAIGSMAIDHGHVLEMMMHGQERHGAATEHADESLDLIDLLESLRNDEAACSLPTPPAMCGGAAGLVHT